jgi:hypothetical protein
MLVRRARSGRVVAVLVAVALATAALLVAPAGAAKSSAPSAASGTCPDPSGKLLIGMSYFGSLGAALNSIGQGEAAELTPAEQATIDGYQKGIDWVNENGGVAGCQLEKKVFNFKAVGVDFNQQSQQECAAFTQDAKAFAVIAVAFETKVANDCFAKAKTPMFKVGNNYPPTCADEKNNAGYIYVVSGIATCRFGAFLDIWKKAGVLNKDSKVGIVVISDGSGQNEALANKVYGPKLKKMGIPYQTLVAPGATSSAGFNETNAAMPNGILKFKSDGVNVVFLTPSGSQAPQAFIGQANAAGFYPDYALDTADGTGIAGLQLRGAGTNVKQAVSVSWVYGDLPLEQQESLPPNSKAQECSEWTAPSTTTIAGASPICDFLTILQEAMEGATKTDAKTLRKGVEALGTKFVSSLTYGGATKFGSFRYDGGTKARVLRWDPNTQAFVFDTKDTKLYTIP